MMNYNQLKQQLVTFQPNADHIGLIKETDITKVLLDALDNKDDENAFYLLKYCFKSTDIYGSSFMPTEFSYKFSSKDKIEINDKLKIQILEKAIYGQLSKSFLYVNKFFELNRYIEDEILNRILRKDSRECYEFLYSNGFFDSIVCLEKCIKIKSVNLHEVIKKHTDYERFVSGYSFVLFDQKDFDNLLFLTKFGLNVSPERYLREVNDIELMKQHRDLGMFNNNLHHFLYFSLVKNRQDEVSLFKEMGASLKSIPRNFMIRRIIYLIIDGKVEMFKTILKEGVDIKDNCNLIISELCKSSRKNVDNIEIVQILLGNSNKEDFKNNLNLLYKYLNPEDSN